VILNGSYDCNCISSRLEELSIIPSLSITIQYAIRYAILDNRYVVVNCTSSSLNGITYQHARHCTKRMRRNLHATWRATSRRSKAKRANRAKQLRENCNVFLKCVKIRLLFQVATIDRSPFIYRVDHKQTATFRAHTDYASLDDDCFVIYDRCILLIHESINRSDFRSLDLIFFSNGFVHASIESSMARI